MKNRYRNGTAIVLPVFLFSVALNALMLVVPLYMLQIYDRVLVSQSMDTLMLLSVITVAALAVFGVLEAVRGVMLSRASVRIDDELSPRILQLIVSVSPGSRPSNDLYRDVGSIRTAFGSRVALALFDLPFVPVFVGVVFLVHPLLGWLTVAGTAVLIGIAALNQRFTRRNERRAHEKANEASFVATALLRNRDDLNAMGMTEGVLERWYESNAATLRASDRASTASAIHYGASRFARLLLQVAVLGLGAFLVIGGEMSAGAIFAASMVSARALGPIEQIIGGWHSLYQATLAVGRVRRALKAARNETDKTGLPAPEGRLEVEQLIHAPDAASGGQPVLQGIGFQVEPGQVVGIVGPSGAGKSTLCKLLAGAETPTRGAVRLDGASIDIWPQSLRRRHIGYMAQQIELLPGTVTENISRFDAASDTGAVFRAAGFVGAHDLIARLPEGYDTRIGPGGRQLSGGETQLIALARAFYGDPRLLVLDEPNAHLDAPGELNFMQVLERARELSITVLVTTQRLQLVKVVDRILVMKDGKIDLYGPRDAVLQKLIPQKGGRKPVKRIEAEEKPTA